MLQYLLQSEGISAVHQLVRSESVATQMHMETFDA